MTGLKHYSYTHFKPADFDDVPALKTIPFEQHAEDHRKEKRLIGQQRVLYRSDDLTKLLAEGQIETQYLPGKTYRLVFTPHLLSAVYRRRGKNGLLGTLLPVPSLVLKSKDHAGYLDLDNNSHW